MMETIYFLYSDKQIDLPMVYTSHLIGIILFIDAYILSLQVGALWPGVSDSLPATWCGNIAQVYFAYLLS